VDTSGAPLSALADRLEDSAPDLMKPNGEELASLTGADGDAIEADPVTAARAASTLVERGVGAVLVTLGGAGAVLVTEAGTWHATPPPTTVVSTVGAGDSSLFGYLLGDLRGLPPAERLRLAVAYGSAAAGLPGTTIPTPSDTHPELVDIAELSHTVD
jgi:1-phosphofructokinase